MIEADALKSDLKLKELWIKTKDKKEFYRQLPSNQFPLIRDLAMRIFVTFPSSYDCEQAYSVLNHMKNAHSTSITNTHLTNRMCVNQSSYGFDFDSFDLMRVDRKLRQKRKRIEEENVDVDDDVETEEEN